ncbi:acetyl-CoA acetyltransferase [Archaeoglobus sulfaticallidus PM70-1]|uniref:Acetyl-CoA acetyltransferase n=1 Tax=Archaeoglobus sulfaticallidus PM70-1 TaxID=387631 RepID=N0BDP4_9EURY|nr:acetyl-CoA C-acetyltransferase [Archaeoglobus sulfaticallidus]AGK61123.1 acetyl-CoA acetyltransferase [Archaeoglobus sulfaticallidus PM70-1]
MDAVIVGAIRTPVGRFGGSLKDLQAYELGAIAIKGLLKELKLKPVASQEDRDFYPSKLPKGLIEIEEKYHDFDGTEIKVCEVIMGNVLQSAQGQNPARQATILAGLPKETPAYTVNKVCGSGLKAIALAASEIKSGNAEIIIAGGMESMSNAPYALTKARWGYRMFNGELIDIMVHDGLWEKFYGYHMGVTAENIAELYGISREEQDQLAYESHMRAIKAIDNGIFAQEIVPVEIQQKKGTVVVDTDEHPRRDTSLEKLAKLPTVFKKDGTVTAGNASGVNDGASALLVMSEEKAEEIGLKPLARIVSYAGGAIDPAYMGLGPIPAIQRALKKAELKLEDIGLIELNEAFAAQALAVIRELNLDMSITNIHGSGISLGHPIGCTGARITTTLVKEMVRSKVEYGLAALCIGGGMGFAMVLQKY